MLQKSFKIISENGIHARIASTLVRVASEFQADIKLSVNNVTVDFKSIMGVMSLGVYKDEVITVTANGIDEEEAIKALGFMILDLKYGKDY